MWELAERLEEKLSYFTNPKVVRLNKPASEEDVDFTEGQLGFPLGPELTLFYTWRNGGRIVDVNFFPIGRPAQLGRWREYALVSRNLGLLETPHQVATPLMRSSVFFAVDGFGDMLFAARPFERGVQHGVFKVDHEQFWNEQIHVLTSKSVWDFVFSIVDDAIEKLTPEGKLKPQYRRRS